MKSKVAAAQEALTKSRSSTIQRPSDDVNLRLPAAARIWNVAVKTARVWVNEGRVAHFRVGRGIRVPLSEVNRLLDEGYRPAREA
jgi:excisionase family DNA binding protein